MLNLFISSSFSQTNIKKQLQNVKEGSGAQHIALEEAKFNDFRIFTDFSYLTNKTDPLRCSKAGETIEWKYKATCKDEDLMNDEKRKVIEGTVSHAVEYIKKLVKVRQVSSSFHLENKYTNFDTQTVVSNVDLYITVVARPYTENIGPCFSASMNPDEYFRPRQGFLYINPQTVPESVETDLTKDNTFYYSILSNIFHILGIDGENYKNYHPKDSVVPHTTILCSLKKNGNDVTFLSTPKSHIFAQKHFGEDYFTGDNGEKCLSGIQLVDNFDDPTEKLSKLNSLRYFTEVLAQFQVPSPGKVLRVTDATLAILEDSGFYEVDYKLVQPLVWGHPESINDRYIPDFALGSPYKAFPSGYLYRNTTDYTASFNFMYYDNPLTEKAPSCPDEQYSEYCKYKEYYNPDNYDYIGLKFYDYAAVMLPRDVCEAGTAALTGTREHCFKYTCSGNSSVEFIVAEKSQHNDKEVKLECTKDKAFQGYHYRYYIEQFGSISEADVYCPDPERFCRTMYLNNLYFDRYPLVIESSSSSGFKLGKVSKIIITISVIIIVMALALLAVVFIVRRLRGEGGKKPAYFAHEKELDDKQIAMLEDF